MKRGRASRLKKGQGLCARVKIRQMPTGVRGLDEILGGGIPEFSFNVIAGAPGCGKTTLAHQIVFANATAEKPALYFTVLGEPAMKMLRYQQQYSFFDEAQVGQGDPLYQSGRRGAGAGFECGAGGDHQAGDGGQSGHRGGGFFPHGGAESDDRRRASWRCSRSSSGWRSF